MRCASSLARHAATDLRTIAILLGVVVSLTALPAAEADAAGLAVDASIKTHQSAPAASITSAALSTTQAGDLLVAFLASDGPSTPGATAFSSVTGGGLTWRLRRRVNAQPGTAEIWSAVAPAVLTNVTVTGTRSSGPAVGSIAVVAFSGAATTVDGATAGASALTGAPATSLTTTGAGSWVWGVGNDWDRALARTVGPGQTEFDEFLPSVGDTYWVQSQTAPGNPAGTAVTVNDTAPTTDRWDLAAIEVIPAAADTSPPTVPTNLTATAVNSNQVHLTWLASVDDVGVAGYRILRGGTLIATTTTTATSFDDTTVSPSTAYFYNVQGVDAAGNLSPVSNTATVTTPALSVDPPVISAVAVPAAGLTTTSATVTWTTDIPSSSQVLYGTSTAYGSSTTTDTAQVTSHAQTLTGLAAGTTYHFAVRSTGGAANTSTSGDGTFTTLQPSGTLTPPDLQIKVPTSAISIATVGGRRQLQFTHITWDAGTGPFEIDPAYDAATGTATFTQAIYRSASPGVWTFDHSVPVAATGVFVPPSDYRFPLTRFTLHAANADGTPGATIATSPKDEYCITGDNRVGGVPDTPNQTFIPQSNCSDPTKPLGWSVGWGDQYDQTDPGQPIDLTGVADGTYVLRAIADPNHVLTESDVTDNVTDTLLQLSGSSVSVLSQTTPGSTPPTVALTSPADGATVSDTVALQATATAAAPATVASVQFLLDGLPLGAPDTAAPYAYGWTVGSTALGTHTLSARATDSAGAVATAASITVTVVPGAPPPPDTTPPTVALTNPVAGQTVSGTVPVAATAADDVAVASVQFLLDGQALGSPDTAAPYAVNWDTTTAAGGAHVLSARATDTSGNTGTAVTVPVTVQNPAPPPPACFILQAQVTAHGTGTVTTPAFHTAAANEWLVAFVGSDGPRSTRQTTTVTGAGLTWTLVRRANAQAGDSEVWAAKAPVVIPSATVRSQPSRGGYVQDLTVIAIQGVGGVGASVAASATTGAPTTGLTTAGAKSLVFAVGNDWDRAVARVLPAGWVSLEQWLATTSGDTFWSQYTNAPTGPAGSVITVGDLAPTTDRWNLVAVELRNDD